MDVYDALVSRRTVFKFTDEVVPDEVVDRALEAGRWAPNHRFTQPWRFQVVGPRTLAAIAEVNAAIGREKASAAGAAPDEVAIAAEQARRQILNVPRLLVVSMIRTPDNEHRQREDFAATCCAIQNIQLALWESGFGAQWATGLVTRAAPTYAALAIDPQVEEIVAFVKAGRPAEVPAPNRKPLAEFVRRHP